MFTPNAALRSSITEDLETGLLPDKYHFHSVRSDQLERIFSISFTGNVAYLKKPTTTKNKKENPTLIKKTHFFLNDL
jgi:hypothetical protein